MKTRRQTFEERLSRAVSSFWKSRAKAADNQRAKGLSSEGNRGAVTAGKTLDSFRDMVAEVAKRCGPRGTKVHRNKALVILPGYFRPTKQWDLLIEHNGRLLAALELKSLCGPSFGNNANNRCEEALGSALDIRKAQAEGMLGIAASPFVGYFILVEDAIASRKAVSTPSPHFPTDTAFAGASYQKRMQLLCERMVQRQLYSCAAVLTSPTASMTGECSDISATTSFRRLLAQLAATLKAEAESSETQGVAQEEQMNFGESPIHDWDSFEPDLGE